MRKTLQQCFREGKRKPMRNRTEQLIIIDKDSIGYVKDGVLQAINTTETIKRCKIVKVGDYGKLVQ
jgi:hypothetical protein